MIKSDFIEVLDSVVDSYSVRIPTYVKVSKVNTKACNLNVYRNLHHHHLNTQKKNFADEVKPLLRDKPKAERVWIHYTIFAPRNGRLDTMNVGSITDKYFSDTMVEAGRIPDDDYEHIVLSTFSFGGVVSMDGYAIATINILTKEKEPMRVLLDQDDIQGALDAYIKTLNLPGATGVELTVNDDGDIEAEVLMGDVKPKNKGGRPRKTAAKPAVTKTETADDSKTDSEGGSDSSDSGGSDESKAEAEEGEDNTPESKVDEGKTKKGNLFGDNDPSPSSDSAQTTEPETTKQTGSSMKPKKPSIFDV